MTSAFSCKILLAFALLHSVFRGSGREELPHTQGQGPWPRQATLCPRSGAMAETSYPMSEVRDGGAWWAAIYGVAQSRTRLKQLSSSGSIELLHL